MNRNLRSILPTKSNHLRPSVVHPDLARERMERKQATQRQYCNQGARELKPLAGGEDVHVQTKSGNWKPPTVQGQHSTARSYTVRTGNGSEYLRNRRHLLTTRSECTKENPRGQGENQKFPQPLRKVTKVLKRKNQKRCLTRNPQPIHISRLLAMSHT